MFRKGLIGLLAILVLAVTAPAQVMLNEFFYDTQGTDDTAIMFVEIYGPAGTNLSGWTLVGINGNGGSEYLTVTLSGTIPADGYFVVGGSAVANVDQVVTADFQNAGSQSGEDCDGIDLRDGDGGLVDHLCYGPCGAGHLCTGEGGSNAPDPFPSTANPNSHLARIPDHSDTDNNGADWVISDALTSGLPNSGTPCVPHIATLSDIRAHNLTTGVPTLLDTFVVTRGIVNVNNGSLDSTGNSKFYFQDDDAGCNVYRGTVPAGIVAGDCVVVSGWVEHFNGLTEIVSSGIGNCLFQVQVTAHVTPPAPTVITGSTPFEAFEGMLVRMNNVTITDGTWPAEGSYGDLVITDPDGTIGLTINKWTNVDGSPAPTQTFDIIGILTQYDRTSPYLEYYEIMPRTTADVINHSAAGDPVSGMLAAEFELDGAFPNPFNSTTQIRFTVGAARTLSLSIFDLLGREVTSATLTGLTPGAHSYTWSPTGATGLYLVRLSGESRVETAKLLYLK
ncbi:T9SS C-terminal target domain-containing protein [candidate division KSB1 bacterium]|nr:MAG: T9SS C-terminal target domain-containing protein [candidate division KSB1 bacterium]